jgi:4-hydroxy-3-methylbut-2-enyl diphosphate reductase IspH
MGSFAYLHNCIISVMSNLPKKRVTIVLDEDLIKKLRIKQAKLIQQTNLSTSFSQVISQELKKCMK